MSKRVLFDNNFFSWYCNNNVRVNFVPEDESDTLELRFEELIRCLDVDAAEIVIPTPVLGEALCHRGTEPKRVLEIIEGGVRFRVVQFDRRAAEEFGHLFRNTARADDENRQIYKFDLQILAIARVEQVDIIYSSDGPMQRIASEKGVNCIGFQELPRPPRDRQEELFPLENEQYGDW